MRQSTEFLFDVERWFGSIAAQRMSFAEKGVYLSMLFQQWRDPERSLPDDPQAVADLIAVSSSQAAEVLAAWPIVRLKFAPLKRLPGRIANRTMERVRRTQLRNFRKRTEASRLAGKASAAKRLNQKELPINERSTLVERSSTVRLGIDRLGSTPPLVPPLRGGVRAGASKTYLPALWNELVRPPLKPVIVPVGDARKRLVRAAEARYPRATWVDIVTRVNAAPCLTGQTGRDWVATFDWLLKAENAAKVLEGQYDDRRAATTPVPVERRATVWDRVLEHVEAALPRHQFHSWFGGTALVEHAGSELVIAIPREEVGAWILRHYAAPLQAALTACGLDGVAVRWRVQVAA